MFLHAFCLVLPYGGVVLLGGVAGLFRIENVTVLALAQHVAPGAALLALGWGSMQRCVKQRAQAPLLNAACLTISGYMAFAMKQRYDATGKVMPGLVIGAASAFMCTFLACELISPEPISKKAAE